MNKHKHTQTGKNGGRDQATNAAKRATSTGGGKKDFALVPPSLLSALVFAVHAISSKSRFFNLRSHHHLSCSLNLAPFPRYLLNLLIFSLLLLLSRYPHVFLFRATHKSIRNKLLVTPYTDKENARTSCCRSQYRTFSLRVKNLQSQRQLQLNACTFVHSITYATVQHNDYLLNNYNTNQSNGIHSSSRSAHCAIRLCTYYNGSCRIWWVLLFDLRREGRRSLTVSSTTVFHWYDVDTYTNPPTQINYLIATPVFTFLSIAYLEITPRYLQKSMIPTTMTLYLEQN